VLRDGKGNIKVDEQGERGREEEGNTG